MSRLKRSDPMLVILAVAAVIALVAMWRPGPDPNEWDGRPPELAVGAEVERYDRQIEGTEGPGFPASENFSGGGLTR